MNKRKPQNCAEVCVCLLLWEPAWLVFSSYQGREFSHGKSVLSVSCFEQEAGLGSLQPCDPVEWARESFVSVASGAAPWVWIPTLSALVATNFRWWKMKVAIGVSHTFWLYAVLLYQEKGFLTLQSRKKQQLSLACLLGRTSNTELSGKEQSEESLVITVLRNNLDQVCVPVSL